MSHYYKNFSFADTSANITLITSIYTRTTSGKSWRRKADHVERETITAATYTKYINTVPCFKDRVEFAYTRFGYIPVKLTSVNPYTNSPTRGVKTVREFIFTEKSCDTCAKRGTCKKHIGIQFGYCNNDYIMEV